MLSHHEQSALDHIAQQLEASDPALAEALRAGKISGRPSMTAVWLAVLGLAGALLLILGIAAASPAVALSGVAALAGMAFVGLWRKFGKDDGVGRTARPPV
jgi:hypothetical protein